MPLRSWNCSAAIFLPSAPLKNSQAVISPSAQLHLLYIGTKLAEAFHTQYATHPSMSLK